MLLKQVKDYIKHHHLLKPGNSVLVATSGGADSMVLLHILQALGYTCAVAHMNFNLRGEASQKDAEFVQAYTKKHALKYVYKSVDTLSYAKENGISVEMAARDLRYAFFDAALKENNISCVAVGHHKNDLVETMLLNLIRGTGVRGLTGIKPKNGNVIRPMLEVTREEIIRFAKENNIEYCTDKTNADTEIKRNYIRHDVLPMFEKLNPSFTQTGYETALRMQQVQDLINQTLNDFKQQHVILQNNKMQINLEGLKTHASPMVILFELLHPLGFNSIQLEEIWAALAAIPGKKWYSKSHRIILSQSELILQPIINKHDSPAGWIEKLDSEIRSPIPLKIGKPCPIEEAVLDFTPEKAYFDADKIKLPLQIRKWKNGDWFIPFGMKGRKKLSDFFIDQKLSLDKKEEMHVVVSGNDIIWIPGYRTDDRCKITENTKWVLQLTLL